MNAWLGLRYVSYKFSDEPQNLFWLFERQHVSRAWKAHEAQTLGGKGGREFLGIWDCHHGVSLTGQLKYGAADFAEARSYIEGENLSAKEVLRNGGALCDTGIDLGRSRALYIERAADQQVLAQILGSGFSEEPLGHGANLRATEPLKHGEGTVEVDTSSGAREDELGRVIGMSNRVLESDEAAKRCAEDDRLLNAQNPAERSEIVCPLVERPALAGAVFAAPVAAVVVVHELSDVAERCVHRLKGRVIEARAAVNEDDSRTLAHGVAVGNQLGAVDIDEQSYAVDRDEHRAERTPRTSPIKPKGEWARLLRLATGR